MKKPDLKNAMVFGAVFLCAFAFILLNCSGLTFPLFGNQWNLNRNLVTAFGVSLPGSAKVRKGSYVAEMDKSEFFMVQMEPNDVRAFETALEDGGRKRNYEFSDPRETRFFVGKPGPSYEPDKLPDIESLRISIPDRGGGTGYWFFLSPSTGRVYVYWYST